MAGGAISPAARQAHTQARQRHGADGSGAISMRQRTAASRGRPGEGGEGEQGGQEGDRREGGGAQPAVAVVATGREPAPGFPAGT